MTKSYQVLKLNCNIFSLFIIFSEYYCKPFLFFFRYNINFPGGQSTFRAELKHLRSLLENVENPIVFCHNDLLLANVIHNSNSVWFIDYEYAGYNYQAYDIANHFAEFAGALISYRRKKNPIFENFTPGQKKTTLQ